MMKWIVNDSKLMNQRGVQFNESIDAKESMNPVSITLINDRSNDRHTNSE